MSEGTWWLKAKPITTMEAAQHSAWEAPGFLNWTLRIWLVQISTVRVSLPPGVRSVLGSWDQQTAGKTTEHVTVNRGRRLVTRLTLPAVTQSCRSEYPETQRQQNIAPKQFAFFLKKQNKTNHSINGITNKLEYESTTQELPSAHWGLLTGTKLRHASVLFWSGVS